MLLLACFIRFWWPWANIQITWPSLNVITENDLHEEPWSSGGLLSTGETCVTGKVKPVPYYLQCPFTTSQQVMAPLHDIIKHNQLSIFICAWSVTFWAAEFESEGFNLVCTIWRQREDVRTRVPCNLQCLGTHALTRLCSEVQLIKVSIDKFYWL